MATRRARLSDIAAQAGVSEATVSRVLNGRPGVAEPTRQAVLTALDVLGYERPARLKQRSAGLVGLIVPGAGQPDLPGVRPGDRVGAGPARVHAGALHPDAGRGARGRLHRDAARARGLRHHLRLRPARRHHGRPRPLLSRCVVRGLPMVFINGYMQGVDAPFVCNDDVASMELAVSHLVSLGHTRDRPGAGAAAVHAGDPQGRRASGRRCASTSGPSGARRAAGRVLAVFSVEGGAAAAGAAGRRGAARRSICGVRPDGARAPIRAAAVDGAGRCPATSPWSGYDDSTLMAFTDPPLTTVRQSVQAMGVGRRAGAAGRDRRRAAAAGRVRLPARARGARLDRGRATDHDADRMTRRCADPALITPGTPQAPHLADTAGYRLRRGDAAPPGGDGGMRISDVVRRKGDVVVTVAPT